MHWLEQLFTENEITTETMLVRLILSLVFGGLIGFEREYRRQPAGFRTHILICLGSCLLMLVSIYIPQTFVDFRNGDPGRIAAQVVSGIGFLGGGAIFKLGANVRGLTTAATIWAAAAVGLAVGTGIYLGSLFAVGLVLFVLLALEKLESRFFPSRSYKKLELIFQAANVPTDPVFEVLEKFSIHWNSVDVQQSLEKNETRLELLIDIPAAVNNKQLYQELRTLKHITGFKLGEEN
jgi:putative Mg2+ transporter-C (MgtC) family protein